MPQRSPKPADGLDYRAIAKQFAKAKAAREAREARDAEAVEKGLPTEKEQTEILERQRERLNARRKRAYERRWWWTAAFWAWLLAVHGVGIWLFASGFLLTRLVLEDKSSCAAPPVEAASSPGAALDVAGGCWHPKQFDRAVVILIDALRYDFTVPEDPATAHAFHNALPFLYETAVEAPQNAFLRPFIADPPTTTLQRLKGLTTGTLPTFIDAGSNFAGTAIDEDNLLMQLRDAGKKIAHLGDDTWWSLFPDHFEANISKAYDSFNVWDLHTVDNGVIDNIFPLLESSREGRWDLLIGHCLGILAAASVPLLVLWKVGPKQRGLLETTARALAVFVAYYAVEALATMSWAGWLRRHLMLYRVFCPRFMLAALVLLVMDLVGVLVALGGLRSNTLAVCEVFGWAE
ncbi:hypothetical protein M440DRAFT_1394619 [Trichoderma longibrachiatum ATCC 18648]|uniref:GPI ethanolamine phosphate transferase 3 n=1 Tax=Trichoderma longibrachiatum ATCC 18648 TaxID=983965 RepID=A0A2T4BU07_TRILO|nr:hypothetical protein M440DRAFT_1394619 [Trichoderma longibrachiatum ATCC 18648]